MSGDGAKRPVPEIIAACAVALGLALLVLPVFEGIPQAARQALGLVIISASLWATEVVPAHLASFIFFFLALVVAGQPAPVVFSGFHSGATWLIFGGIVLGHAINSTGLGARFAEGLIARRESGYSGLVIGIGLVAFLLSFVMPSAMGRVVLLTPIVGALCDKLGYGAESRGRAGLVLTMIFATALPPSAILPATVPNVILSGAAESIHGVVFRYGEFLLLHMTVFGSLTLLLVLVLGLTLFREAPPVRLVPEVRGPVTGVEKRLMAVLALTLLFWTTDSLHGVAPAWVALGAAVVCLLPVVRLVPPSAMIHKVNYGPWFFVAGIVGMGAVVSHSGLAGYLGEYLIRSIGIAPQQDAYNFFAMILTGGILSLGVNYAGVPAILTPLMGDLAVAAGWPLETMLMTQVASFFFILLPYQIAPVFTGMLLAGIPQRYGIRMCLIFTVIHLLVVSPLNFLWWRWLGVFSA
ncbi:MAG: SLC13 family permease [Alphaproteobacteria bacterium]